MAQAPPLILIFRGKSGACQEDERESRPTESSCEERARQRIPSAEPGSITMDAEYAPKGHTSMFSPFLSRKHRSDEEVAEWERQQAKLGQDYDSPWLSGLITFSGFVAAFIGSVDALFVIANLRHGTVWLPYALTLAALVGAHLCLRAVRYQRRRHARQSAVGDHRQVTRDRHSE
jgi:hypothetical protein